MRGLALQASRRDFRTERRPEGDEVIGNAQSEGMRGRAGGSWVFAIGTQPVGNLQVGILASLISVPAALVINGAALVGVGAVSLLVFKSLRRL